MSADFAFAGNQRLTFASREYPSSSGAGYCLLTLLYVTLPFAGGRNLILFPTCYKFQGEIKKEKKRNRQKAETRLVHHRCRRWNLACWKRDDDCEHRCIIPEGQRTWHCSAAPAQ